MASRKSGLGKGLDSLITNKVGTRSASEEKEQEEKEKADFMVKITKVEPNREQPRKKFDEDALLELAESLKQYGILQPLLVQKRDDYYEIIAGERRWRAAKLAGLKEVPVIVKDLSDQEIMEISLIENIQREDLNPIEEAHAYKRLLTEFNLKQDEVAERVSKSRSAITNSMRLLKLCDKVQQMIIDEKLTMGHVRPLIGIEDPEEQYAIAQKIFDERLTVRETEKLLKKIQKEKENPKKKEDSSVSMDFLYENLEEQMKQILGTKVNIHPKKNNKGKIEIEYYSQDELNRLLELMQTIHK
ncbi:MAG TPA: ParB/RepB/Spo0J family partition protein [Candidatus Eubacterium avistercoris]|uniref:ParB/RepB/Spo0J family partition protein n=1 Tax=Candidatus Eubacterium avistercoris TaxID=2838567 RepID=A0A9D2D0V0_9FIRM|nr:ParB/RepB/Spo0J family partition protein [Candidatus Eubacterium avistercoris]